MQNAKNNLYLKYAKNAIKTILENISIILKKGKRARRKI
jgi:hypothetical protein